MRNSKFSNICSIFVLTSILLLYFSSTSFSQSYHINSTQSTQKWGNNTVDAGMSTGTVILIGVAAAAVVVGVVLFVNSGSDEDTGDNSSEGKDKESDTEENPSDLLDDGAPILLLQNNLKNEQNEYTEQQIPLNIYLSMKRNNFQLSDNTFEIGVAFNF